MSFGTVGLFLVIGYVNSIGMPITPCGRVYEKTVFSFKENPIKWEIDMIGELIAKALGPFDENLGALYNLLHKSENCFSKNGGGNFAFNENILSSVRLTPQEIFCYKHIMAFNRNSIETSKTEEEMVQCYESLIQNGMQKIAGVFSQFAFGLNDYKQVISGEYVKEIRKLQNHIYEILCDADHFLRKFTWETDHFTKEHYDVKNSAHLSTTESFTVYFSIIENLKQFLSDFNLSRNKLYENPDCDYYDED